MPKIIDCTKDSSGSFRVKDVQEDPNEQVFQQAPKQPRRRPVRQHVSAQHVQEHVQELEAVYYEKVQQSPLEQFMEGVDLGLDIFEHIAHRLKAFR